MSGQFPAKKPWAAQTVFDLPLENIKQPVLIVGHAADSCIRSPASLMNKLNARIHSQHQQVVTVTGGPGYSGSPGLKACEGRAPHGYIDQELEVSDGITRFIRSGNY
jgi:hypothetical protein